MKGSGKLRQQGTIKNQEQVDWQANVIFNNLAALFLSNIWTLATAKMQKIVVHAVQYIIYKKCRVFGRLSSVLNGMIIIIKVNKTNTNY